MREGAPERRPLLTCLMPSSRQVISDSRTTNSNAYSSAASPATDVKHALSAESSIPDKPRWREVGCHGGTRMVMFSTTYSESAYPSNCGMYELKRRHSVSRLIAMEGAGSHLFSPLTLSICAEL